MVRDGRRKHTGLFWLLAILLSAALACAQAGQILTPEEATRQAAEAAEQARAAAASSSSAAAEGEALAAGTAAVLRGRAFLINLMEEPGGRVIAGQERGTGVTVVDSQVVDSELWYLIEAPTGEGWVPGENVEAADDGGGLEAEFAPGDTAYLTGRGFLISLYDSPGSNRFIAQQERAVAVEILEVGEADGDIWYLISAPTGEGWVIAENLEAEPS